ncbi:glycosyltransferase family 2 protein [Bacillus paramycoides]|uniref:glycosyltransferase family 2 protein n=1 Tax=Bacillus paramycoides TaxID=2026194 RepID=UPI002E20B687|nr:glycosyltransferase family 2 protein [Bacillus paramycoides]
MMLQTNEIILSIVVPIYNVEKYLEECISSLLNQEIEREIEILLIDDGSTDSSKEIMEKYSKVDNRIVCIYKKNEGLGPTRNVGTKRAKGKYILYLDSDDYLQPNTLNKLIKEIEKNEQDIIIFNGEGFYDESYKICKKRYFQVNSRVNNYSGSLKKYCLLDLHQACLKVQSKKFLEDNNIYFSNENTYGEDVYFWLTCIGKTESIKYVDLNLYRRRYREGSIMTNPGRNARDRLATYKELIDITDDRVVLNFVRDYFFKWWGRGIKNKQYLDEIDIVVKEKEFKTFMYENGEWGHKVKFHLWEKKNQILIDLLTYSNIGLRRVAVFFYNKVKF